MILPLCPLYRAGACERGSRMPIWWRGLWPFDRRLRIGAGVRWSLYREMNS